MNDKQIKGLVGGIQKFSTEDGPGIRTTVFLKGCPLSCKWCHNPELIDPELQLLSCTFNCINCGACAAECPRQALSFPKGKAEIDRSLCDRCMKCTKVCYAKALNPAGKWMTVDEVMQQVLQDKDFYLHTNGGMTISGGELLTQADFAYALIQACRDEGIGVVLDTSGFGDYDTLARLAENCNCTHILFDMKLIDSEKHREYTGVENELILDNLKQLTMDPALNRKIIMRMPLMKDVNDTDEIIKMTCRFYVENQLKSVTLLPYHELGISKKKHLGETPVVFEPPAKERMEEIKQHFIACGMNVEVLGQKE
jgi:glycyl-radical enzyme activating protein family